jgi:hypothetical protein
MNGNEISRLWPFFEGLIATTENTKSAEIKYFHFLRILDFYPLSGPSFGRSVAGILVQSACGSP